MTRAIRTSIIACAGLLMLASLLVAQDRAQEVLAQARAAVAGKAFDKVTSLAVGASVRRVVPAVNMELTSTVQLEFLFPDKYRRSEDITVGPMTRSISVGLNGQDLLYDDGGAAALTGIDPKAPGPMRDQTIKGLKEDAFRMLTVLLLAPPTNLIPELTGGACTITSAGVAEAPDGKADVVDVKGPNGLNLRLFFDTSSHRLLLATYTTESIDAAQMKEFTQNLMQKAQADPGNAKQLVQDATAEMAKLPKKTITMQMHFSEPKAVNGITMPTKMTVEGGPQGQEEWIFTSIKVNPTFKPDRFVK